METPVSSLKVWLYVVGPLKGLRTTGGVVWSKSIPEGLVERAELQHMFCCLTASIARALLCMGNGEFRV